MKMKQWVVDTWVLERCNDFSSNDCLDCISFLCIILDYGTVCLDTEREIEAEYYRYIRSGTFLSRWWHRIVREKGQIYYFSNKLSNKHKVHLVNNLNFDQSDVKFVGVASKTRNRLLTSGDSDYNKDICNYLFNELTIRVICPKEAVHLP